MTPLEEITDRDRTRWSLHGANALKEILERAYLADMPPLVWQVTGNGLLGAVPPSYGSRDEYAEFRRWVDFLGALIGREMRTADGMRHVRAESRYLTRTDRRVVQVVLRAVIDREYKVTAPPAA